MPIKNYEKRFWNHRNELIGHSVFKIFWNAYQELWEALLEPQKRINWS